VLPVLAYGALLQVDDGRKRVVGGIVRDALGDTLVRARRVVVVGELAQHGEKVRLVQDHDMVNPVVQLDQLPLDAPVAPQRVIPRHPQVSRLDEQAT